MGFPSKNTGVGCHFLLQGIFLTQGSKLGLPTLNHLGHQGISAVFHSEGPYVSNLWILTAWSSSMYLTRALLSRVQCSVTSWTVAHQAPLSIGFSGQEYWNGLPFPTPGVFHIWLTIVIHFEWMNGRIMSTPKQIFPKEPQDPMMEYK